VSDRPEGPLQRWSRLKRTQATPKEKTGRGAAAPMAPEDADRRDVVSLTDTGEEKISPAPQPPQEPDALPDVASLGKDSDFSAFLRQGVPEEMRRQALRVLWRSDPVLANLDGLNDYDEDFTVVRTVAEAVRTAYETGKEYLEDEDGAEPTDGVGAADEPAEPADTAPREPIAVTKSDERAEESATTKPDPDSSAEAVIGDSARDRNKT
jgi:hypothetical protein